MIKVHTWTNNLRKFLLKSWRSTGLFLEKDLMESKWGQRVLDQVFREGRFSKEPDSDSTASAREES